MVLIIDNYDSFTYNLVELIERNTNEYRVFRNDTITLNNIELLSPSHILISPGPGRPENAGICNQVIKNFCKQTSILGVCLGHQAIGFVYGCEIIRSPIPMHGKTSLINHDRKSIYRGIQTPFEVMRYHSLIIKRESIPDELIITSETTDGIVMGIRHKTYPLEGIQFHPESILTLSGEKIINNWLETK